MPDATSDAVRAIARQLDPDRIGTGPLATLRRLDPGRPCTAPALHRLLAEHHPAAADSPRSLAAWTLIVHAMALMAPEQLAQERLGLGKPLFDAGLAEGRMTDLLEARAEDLPIRVPRTVRFLRAQNGLLDGFALAWFVLDLGSGDPERADRQRVRVARDYFRAEHAAQELQRKETP